MRAPVVYLEDAARRGRAEINAEHRLLARAAPQRYFRALRYVRRHAELDEGYTNSSRYTCFDQAVYLAGVLLRERRAGRPITHLHAHFAHDPALIALLTHMLTGVSFSFTAHARDLYQVPAPALARRIAAASAVVTCCGSNLGYFAQVAPGAGEKVRLIYHGVNLEGFQPAAENKEQRTKNKEQTVAHPEPVGQALPGRPNQEQRTKNKEQTVAHPEPVGQALPGRPSQEPLILSVGRLVEKKGFPDLLRACGRLKQAGRRFRCVIYGEGPLHGELAALIEQLGLADDVTLAGATDQRRLVPEFQRAAVFALTPFVTDDGDRDGVPNVLVEAMACGLPVVSTAVAGIPELVEHDHNGILAAPHDVEAITAGLAALLDDEPRRRRLGAAARQTATERFDLRTGAQQMAALFARSPEFYTRHTRCVIIRPTQHRSS